MYPNTKVTNVDSTIKKNGMILVNYQQLSHGLKFSQSWMINNNKYVPVFLIKENYEALNLQRNLKKGSQ